MLNFREHIWKIIPQVSEGLVFVETRNKQDRQVSYWIIQLNVGTTHRLALQPEAGWWKGMLDYWNGIILLHGYEQEGLPIHQGLFAYDSSAGKLLWSDSEIRLQQSCEEGILTSSSTVLEWQSGQPISPSSLTPLSISREKIRHYPKTSLEGSPIFDQYRDSLEGMLQQSIVGQVASLELGRLQLVQAYTGILGDTLRSHWFKLEEEKANLISEAEVPGLLLDAFFVEGDLMFFMPGATLLAWEYIGERKH